MGTRVVILQDTPHPGFSIPDCLSKHVSAPDACAFDAAHAVDAKLVEAEQRAVDEDRNARYVSTFDLLCDRTICPAERDSVVRFQDDHHISQKFAQSLASEISKRLTAALQ
jgi:hypothetical protein